MSRRRPRPGPGGSQVVQAADHQRLHVGRLHVRADRAGLLSAGQQGGDRGGDVRARLPAAASRSMPAPASAWPAPGRRPSRATSVEMKPKNAAAGSPAWLSCSARPRSIRLPARSTMMASISAFLVGKWRLTVPVPTPGPAGDLVHRDPQPLGRERRERDLQDPRAVALRRRPASRTSPSPGRRPEPAPGQARVPGSTQSPARQAGRSFRIVGPYRDASPDYSQTLSQRRPR